MEDNPFGDSNYPLGINDRIGQMTGQHNNSAEAKFDPHQNHPFPAKFGSNGQQVALSKQNGNLYTGEDSDDGGSCDDMSGNRFVKNYEKRKNKSQF